MKLKQSLCGLLAAVTALTWMPVAAEETAQASAPPTSLCAAYVVMDADTGQVLIEKNGDERHYPASITKIMTLGLALEKAQGQLDAQLTVSHDDVHRLEPGSSHIALIEGETVRLEDILYGTQIRSANDGANVLAAYVGGSIDEGVRAMNNKAQELGLAGTHYVNPHGLHAAEHYTTARDMANLTRWALQQPNFMDIFCRTDTWTMAPTDKQPKERPFSIDDWMRLSGKYHRDYARGSKTGFTNEAGYTFVSYAEQNDMRLICVILAAPQRYDKFIDACALLDYCFANFQRREFGSEESFKVPVTGGGGTLGEVTVSGGKTSLLMHRETPDSAVRVEYHIPEEMVLGRPFGPQVTFSLESTAGQAPASVDAELEYTGLDQVLKASTYVPLDQMARKHAGIWGVVLGVLLVVVCVVLVIRLGSRRQKTKKKKYKKQSQWEGPDLVFMPSPSDSRRLERPNLYVQPGGRALRTREASRSIPRSPRK